MEPKQQAGETAAERQRRREAILEYGPIFAPTLRFPFDEPDRYGADVDAVAEAETKRKMSIRA